MKELKKLWNCRGYLMWEEWVDGVAHALHFPRFIQRRLCDWVDNTYYN